MKQKQWQSEKKIICHKIQNSFYGTATGLDDGGYENQWHWQWRWQCSRVRRIFGVIKWRWQISLWISPPGSLSFRLIVLNSHENFRKLNARYNLWDKITIYYRLTFGAQPSFSHSLSSGGPSFRFKMCKYKYCVIKIRNVTIISTLSRRIVKQQDGKKKTQRKRNCKWNGKRRRKVMQWTIKAKILKFAKLNTLTTTSKDDRRRTTRSLSSMLSSPWY